MQFLKALLVMILPNINKYDKVVQNANPSLGKNSIFATHTAHIAELL